MRKVALARGKEDDDRWIAHYATSCFAGVALRWFEGLDEEAQGDWRKLRKAMLQRWSDDKTDDLIGNLSNMSLGECKFRSVCSIGPLSSTPKAVPASPAAAPPRAQPLQASSSVFETQPSAVKRGYIRVDGIPATRTIYIHRQPGSSGPFSTAVKAQDRMLVDIAAKAPPHRIRLLVFVPLGINILLASLTLAACCRTLKAAPGWGLSGKSFRR